MIESKSPISCYTNLLLRNAQIRGYCCAENVKSRGGERSVFCVWMADPYRELLEQFFPEATRGFRARLCMTAGRTSAAARFPQGSCPWAAARIAWNAGPSGFSDFLIPASGETSRAWSLSVRRRLIPVTGKLLLQCGSSQCLHVWDNYWRFAPDRVNVAWWKVRKCVAWLAAKCFCRSAESQGLRWLRRAPHERQISALRFCLAGELRCCVCVFFCCSILCGAWSDGFVRRSYLVCRMLWVSASAWCNVMHGGGWPTDLSENLAGTPGSWQGISSVKISRSGLAVSVWLSQRNEWRRAVCVCARRSESVIGDFSKNVTRSRLEVCLLRCDLLAHWQAIRCLMEWRNSSQLRCKSTANAKHRNGNFTSWQFARRLHRYYVYEHGRFGVCVCDFFQFSLSRVFQQKTKTMSERFCRLLATSLGNIWTSTETAAFATYVCLCMSANGEMLFPRNESISCDQWPLLKLQKFRLRLPQPTKKACGKR